MIGPRDIQAVVLMGGLGTRIRDEAAGIPKAMADVCGKPFFLYQLELMKLSGFKDFLFCVGHKAEAIEGFFGNGSLFGIKIEYSYDGEKLLGTGGALRRALPLLKEDFLLIYGDSYMDADYGCLVCKYDEARSKKGKKGLMSVFKNKDQYGKSNVVFKDGAIALYDKSNSSSEMEHIDYGVALLNKSAISEIPDGEYTDLAEMYSELVEKGLMAGYEVPNRFYEIGTPSSLKEFREFIYLRLQVKKPAIFLDRDGTINEIIINDDTGQPDSPLRPDQLRLIPGASDAIRLLRSLGYLLIVVTNQPAAAKGKAALGDLYDVNDRLRDLLSQDKTKVDDILMCPHHPTGGPKTLKKSLIADCDCRKPRPGLLIKAIEKFNIEVKESYIAGDSFSDVLAGKELGIKSVFIGNYKCDSCRLLGSHKPDGIFESLYDFARSLEKTREPEAA